MVKIDHQKLQAKGRLKGREMYNMDKLRQRVKKTWFHVRSFNIGVTWALDEITRLEKEEQCRLLTKL